VQSVQVSVDGGSTWNVATGTTAWSYDWTPTLSGSATIKSRAIDNSGNQQDPPAQVTVTVQDGTPPTVTSFSPMRGAINVSLDENVNATFNEQIDSSTVNNSTVELQDPSGALTPATVSYNSASRAVTLDPTAPLAEGTKYTAVVKGGDAGIKDLAGNPMAADLTWSFTTATPPRVLSITPARDAVNISLYATPVATFTQSLDPTNVNSSTVTLTDATNMPVNSIISVRSVGRILLVPNEPLQYGQRYTMTLKGGPGSPRITNLAGTPLASDYTWSFTTASRDTGGCNSVSFNATPRIDLPSDSYGDLLLVNDFNQDSRLDLVTVKAGFGAKQSLLFFPGASDGGFGSPVNALSLPNDKDQFSDLAAGDFNNDGALDIAAIVGNVNSPNPRSLWIIQNNGAGGFAPVLTINIRESPMSVTTGDFNSDGKTDIVIAVTGALDNEDALLFLNDGMGGFGLPLPIRPGFPPEFSTLDKVKSVDVDRDGKLDLVLFNRNAANGGWVTIYKGDGAGGFTFQSIPDPILSQPSATAIGDFNGDSYPDILIVLPGEMRDEIIVLPNDGTGSFGPGVTTQTGQPIFTIKGAIAEDFDGDGKTDVALRSADQGNFTGITLFTATTGGRFSEPIIYQPSVVAPAMAAGDFNRDGLPDILCMNNIGRLTIMSAQGGGFNAPRGIDFSPPRPFLQLFNGASDLKSGDLNGDGAPDLVITAGGLSDAVIMFGNGRGEFGAPVSINTGAPSSSSLGAIEIQDFNNDGKLDLAALAFYPSNVVVLLGDGQGSFTPSATINAGTGVSTITSGDFNNDGKLDLVVKGEASGLALYLGDGQGGFTQIATGIGGNIDNFYFTAGDFNGDGNRDLAIYDNLQSGTGDGFNIVILPGDGHGGFGQPSNVMVLESLRFLSAKDLNLDGRDDLFYTPSYIGDAVYVALSNSGGGFDAPLAYQVGAGTISVTASDINGDGKPDLLSSSFDTGTVSLLLGDGAGGFNQQAPLPVFDAPGLIVTGDFDQDGRIDLAIPRNGASVIAIINNKTMCIPQSGAAPASSASSK
jgi:hypothetical protein